MKKVVAKVAFTLALAAPAFAWAVNPGPHPTGTFDSTGGAFSDASTHSGAFLDSFSLNLVPGEGDWEITSVSYPNYGISNFGVELLQGGVAIPGDFTSTTSTLGKSTITSWSEVFGELTGGPYTLEFSGTFAKNGGSYGGSFGIVPAVPEPSTWFAMLVGMGLMLTVARKRKNQF
jgi:hypothetical protein